MFRFKTRLVRSRLLAFAFASVAIPFVFQLPFDRPLVAQETSIKIFAAGQTGEESFALQVNGQTVAEFIAGGDARAGQFNQYNYVSDAVPDEIRIVFTNDFNNNGTIDRNLRVDAIEVDSVRFETEEPSVFSVGSWRPEDDCAPGFKRSEWLHCNGYFLFDFSVVPIGIPGAIGSATTNQRWKIINAPSVSEPVVILGVPSANDREPGVAQVKNVTEVGFELRFKEWNYLDGVHGFEDVDWLVLQKGRFASEDGSEWEVGNNSLDGNGSWKRIDFERPFQSPPSLFLTVQTQNGAPVTVRAKNIDLTGFEAAIFEEQATRLTSHGNETVGYLAIDGGSLSGVVSFGDDTLPYLLDSGAVGTGKTSVAGVDLFVQEETSADAETNHAEEWVNVIKLGNKVFAMDTSFVGGDTIALRSVNPKLDIQLPAGFELDELNGGQPFGAAIGLEISEDGRIFVAEETGLVWEIVNGIRRPVPVLDVRGQVANRYANSGGLSGFVLDPDFLSNRYIYVMYTADDGQQSFGRVERYTLSPQTWTAVATTRKALIGQDANDGLAAGVFHNVGDLEFGQDGSLMISWGDTASNAADDPAMFRPQDPAMGAGKIFRVNPRNGRGYRSNPFFDGRPLGIQSRTWALGLRNGFRFAIQPGSGSDSTDTGNPGTLYIADVGRNGFEELNLSREGGGENFGWPYFEGDLRFRGGEVGFTHVAPVAVLPHPESRSVIGGVFYDAAKWPTTYQNKYLMADFVEGWVRAYSVENDGSWSVQNLATGLKGITDMKLDPTSGQVYIVGRGRNLFFAPGEGLNGLYRIRFGD